MSASASARVPAHPQRRGSVFFDLPQTYSRILPCLPTLAIQ